MNKQDIKRALIAVAVGASVAFFTALFEGLLEVLQGYGNNIAGGVATSALYALKSLKSLG